MKHQTLSIIKGICYAGVLAALCIYFERTFLTKYPNDKTLLLVLRLLFYLTILSIAYLLTYVTFLKKPKSKEPCPKCGEYQFFQYRSKLDGQQKRIGIGKILCFYECKSCGYKQKRPEKH